MKTLKLMLTLILAFSVPTFSLGVCTQGYQWHSEQDIYGIPHSMVHGSLGYTMYDCPNPGNCTADPCPFSWTAPVSTYGLVQKGSIYCGCWYGHNCTCSISCGAQSQSTSSPASTVAIDKCDKGTRISCGMSGYSDGDFAYCSAEQIRGDDEVPSIDTNADLTIWQKLAVLSPFVFLAALAVVLPCRATAQTKSQEMEMARV